MLFVLPPAWFEPLQQQSPALHYRGIDLEEEAENRALPWGLYLRDAEGSPEARAVLDYCLPLENHREIIVWGTPTQASSGPKLNENLVMNLFQEFSKSNEDLRKWAEFFGQFGSMEYKAVRAALINFFSCSYRPTVSKTRFWRPEKDQRAGQPGAPPTDHQHL